MADLNATLLPVLEPIHSVLNTVRLLVGGVFGIYVIMLYFRWREYVVMKKILKDIREHVHALTEKQGIDMEKRKAKKAAKKK
jgi:hypothetical protein